jgi:general secretion pathway protein M
MAAVMKSAPSHFDSAQKRRAGAIALLVLAILLIIAAIAVPAWLLYQRYATASAMLTRQLSSYTALNHLRPTLLQGVETLRGKKTQTFFVKGNTPALMGADLQDVVRNVIEAGGGRLMSSQLLPHKDEGGYRLVTATIMVSANVQNARRILYDIESRTPYLLIENFTVRSQVPPGYKPVAGFEPDMMLTFDVIGMAPSAGVVNTPTPEATNATATGSASATASPSESTSAPATPAAQAKPATATVTPTPSTPPSSNNKSPTGAKP